MSSFSLANIHSSKTFRIVETLLCFACLAAVIIFCFSLLKYSFYPVDEPYQIMNSMDYLNSPLAPLTAILDHFTNSLCGYEYLKMKYVAFGYNILAVFAGCIYFYTHTKKLNLSLLLCSFSTLLFLISDMYNWIGWDRQTVLFTTLCLVSFLYYLEKGNIWILAITAFFASVDCLCRIPNIAVFPIIACIILFKKNLSLKYRLRDIAIFLFISAGLILMFICAAYGSIGNYLLSVQKNLIPKHEAIYILFEYFLRFCSITLISLQLFAIYLVSKKFCTKWYFTLLFAIIFSLILLYDIRFRKNQIFSPVEGLLISSIFCLFISGWYRNFKEKGSLSIVFITIFAFALLPTIGSNMALKKLLLIPFLPIIIFYSLPAINRWMKIVSVIIVATFVLVPVFELKENEVIHQTRNYTKRTAVFDFHPVQGVYANPKWASHVEEIRADLAEYKDSKVIVAGSYIDRFFFEWIYDCCNEYLRHDYMDYNRFNEEKYVDYISNKIKDSKQDVAVLYLYKTYYWEESNKPYESKMSQMLESELNLAVKKDRYAIFTSKE